MVMSGAKELEPIHEFPLPQLGVDLEQRVVRAGKNEVYFHDDPRWNLMLRFFQNPNQPIPSREVFETLIAGKKARRLGYGWGNLDPSLQVGRINAEYREVLGFAPIIMVGKTSATRYILKAEVNFTNGNIEDYLSRNQGFVLKPASIAELMPPRKVLPERPDVVSPKPNHAPRSLLPGKLQEARAREVGKLIGVELDTDYLRVPSLDFPEIQLLAKLRDGQVILDSRQRELIPDINEKLRGVGYYITVSRGQYELKYDGRRHA